MVGPIDVKRKWCAWVRYWVQYVNLTFDLPHDIDLWCFKVKSRNSSISGIVGRIDVKWIGSELIWYWAYCITLPNDLDLGVSRSESEKALSQERAGPLTWNQRDGSHPLMTRILICVTMGGRIYRIVTGVTSDVGVPSTYLDWHHFTLLLNHCKYT